MSYTDNEIIDSYDGERYELPKEFVEGMIDAGFGINPKDQLPTIENNDIDTLRFEYQEGYSFASDLESQFGDDVANSLLVYVRDTKKAFEQGYLFSLVALNNKMAEKIYSALNEHFSGFHITYQQFGNNHKKYWV